MADLLQRGMDWLAGQMKEHASQSVLYVRGEQSVSVPATIGRTDFEVADAYGVMQHVVSRDYLIPAGDLNLNGHPALPQRGDGIHETRNGRVFRYQVVAPQGQPHWRYSDAYHRVLRVHTKLISGDEL